jgi:hypothetical protein
MRGGTRSSFGPTADVSRISGREVVDDEGVEGIGFASTVRVERIGGLANSVIVGDFGVDTGDVIWGADGLNDDLGCN